MSAACAIPIHVMLMAPGLPSDTQIIGTGGYSTVYRATWNQQAVAAKQLTGDGKSIKHEAYIMSLLNHPNIVPVYGRGE
jgi:serine/threonine protein kinase